MDAILEQPLAQRRLINQAARLRLYLRKAGREPGVYGSERYTRIQDIIRRHDDRIDRRQWTYARLLAGKPIVTTAQVAGWVRSKTGIPAPSAAPAAAPAAAAPAAAAPVGAVSDPVLDKVTEIVSEMTGYSADLLDPDLDLEADLGVDTVKQAEVFAAVRDAYLAAGPKGQARRVIAKSPVTGQSYTMNCLPEEEIVVCRGGNGAVVHIY